MKNKKLFGIVILIVSAPLALMSYYRWELSDFPFQRGSMTIEEYEQHAIREHSEGQKAAIIGIAATFVGTLGIALICSRKSQSRA